MIIIGSHRILCYSLKIIFSFQISALLAVWYMAFYIFLSFIAMYTYFFLTFFQKYYYITTVYSTVPIFKGSWLFLVILSKSNATINTLYYIHVYGLVVFFL